MTAMGIFIIQVIVDFTAIDHIFKKKNCLKLMLITIYYEYKKFSNS